MTTKPTPCPGCNDRRWVAKIGACLKCHGAGPVSSHPPLLKHTMVQALVKVPAEDAEPLFV